MGIDTILTRVFDGDSSITEGRHPLNERPWQRPADQTEARQRMLQAERQRDYESAALAALATADCVSWEYPEDIASCERQALVYASLHRAQTALFVAEQRQSATQ